MDRPSMVCGRVQGCETAVQGQVGDKQSPDFRVREQPFDEQLSVV
jgi:hypothetical protein